MLKVFAQHVTRLLREQPYTAVEDTERQGSLGCVCLKQGPARYGARAADPETLAVLCRAFASLHFKEQCPYELS